MKYSREIAEGGGDSLSQIAARVNAGSLVLDLGIGSGSLGCYLSANKNCRVHGVDIDADFSDELRLAYERLEQTDLECEDALREFSEYRYDFVVLADVLEHLDHPARLLRSASALLAPGGRLLLSVPNVAYAGVVLELLEGRFDYREEGILDTTHVRFYTLDSLLALLHDAGLSAESVDAVELPLSQSEFQGATPELLPAALRDALAARSDSLAYQYIVSAVVQGMDTDAVAPVVDYEGVQGRFEARLYWMSAGDLNHTESKQQSRLLPLGDEATELQFTVSDEQAIEVLRYAPADRPGRLSLLRLAVEDMDSGESVNLLDAAQFDMQGSLHQGMLLGVNSVSLALQLVSAQAWLELDLRPLFSGRECRRLRLSVTQSWPRSQDYQAPGEQLVRQLEINQALSDELVEHRAHRRGLTGEVGALKEQLAHSELRLHRLESSRLWRWSRAVHTHLSPLRHFWLRMRWTLRLTAVTNGEQSGPVSRYAMKGDSGHLYFATPAQLCGKVVFFQIRLRGDEAMIGPTLYHVIDGELSEILAPLYTHRHGNRLFGTLRFPDDLQGLVLAPSRVDCLVTLDSFRLWKIPEPLHKLVQGYWHVLWNYMSFGGAWVVERWKEDLAIFFEDFPRLGERRSYAHWWSKYGAVSRAELQRQRDTAAGTDDEHLISLLLPVYNTSPALLELALESVLAQTWPHWELCIADDCSSDTATRAVLERYEQQDARIKVVWREKNGHISHATNSALELASGKFVAFLDHDDELAPNALFEVASVLKANDTVRLLYSDEDIVGEDGTPLRPHFKPDWNLDFLLSVNYLCHLVVMERELVLSLGGLRAGYEGAQDYDLILRASRVLQPENIFHLPKVLYHWRAIEGSTAQDMEGKDYALEAGKRALEDYLQQEEIAANVEISEVGTAYRLRYALPAIVPTVSILIPTRNGLGILRHCIESIQARTDYPDYQIVIIDNQSDDPATLEYLQTITAADNIRLIHYDDEFNFSAIMNAAVAAVDSEVVVLMNNDMEVINADWLREMVSHAVRDGIGAVGAKLMFPSELIQHAGVVLGLGHDGIAGHSYKGLHKYEIGHLGRLRLIQNYSAVTGACLAVLKSRYEEVQGLDENNLAIAFNDVDFCLKLVRAGYRNLWTPYAQLYHFESLSRGYDSDGPKRARFERERDYMLQQWGELLRDDPCYSPNLTRAFENFSFAWPPLERT